MADQGKARYIMALDQGTTSSRGILFDEQGAVAGLGQQEFKQSYPRPGWVEQDPMEILYSQYLAMAAAAKKAGAKGSEIAALGITNQRETVVVWDDRTGKPVYPAIVWQCRRTAGRCEELRKQGKETLITEKTGLLADPYFSGTKLAWILEEVATARPLLEAGRLRCGTIDTWLIWNLTGGAVYATDYSNASRTMLFNIDELKWDEELCSLLGIPISILPEVRSSAGDFGVVASGIRGIEDMAGIPIRSAIGDQQAALFGQGCFEAGQAKNTYGTGCFLLMNTGNSRIRSANRLLSTIAWGLGGEVEYALEGSVFNAGSAIKWLRDELRIISTAAECDQLAAECPDNEGVYFVPAFTGLGAPYWDTEARGVLCGLTRGSGRRQMARAVLESIAYQVKDLLDAMTVDSGITQTSLNVDGGAAVSNVLMQFQADLLNIPVDRPKTVETTALGAAALAGLACGFWQQKEEVRRLRRTDQVFIPAMAVEERHRLHSQWQKAVRKAISD